MTPEEMKAQEQQEINDRLAAIGAAFQDPATQALMGQLVDGFNAIYDEAGQFNMLVQVRSIENENGRSWVASLEDNYTRPGSIFRVEVRPDKTVGAPEFIQANTPENE